MISISRATLRATIGRRRISSWYSPDNIFSEENMKTTTAKFAAMRPIRMHTHQPSKKAAVLIPLCLTNGKVALLYTLRSANLKTHRGQVSFPGGMQDISDKSLEETALRETQEELGIMKNDVEIWGSGNFIVTKKDTSVLPVIGRLKNPLDVDALRINPKEVSEVFAVTLQDLCNPEKIGYTQFRGAYSTPVFLGGKLRIWGLTALITNLFLTSLLSQQAYSHQIKYISPVRTQKHL